MRDQSQNGQEACDKRLNRLISYIHHTCEYKQYCYVGTCSRQSHQTLGEPRMDIKILENLSQVTTERGNLWERQRSDYSHKDYGRSWSSQEWKSGAGERDRSGKPEEKILGIHCKTSTLIVKNIFSAGLRILQGTESSFTMEEQSYFEKFIVGSDATEFMNKVKDQMRNRQKRMSSIAESCNEHSMILGMFMATTLNAATLMGKNFPTIQSVVKNHESLALKQIFDVQTQLVNIQEEINCLDKILYGKKSWTHLSFINVERVINQFSKQKSLCILKFCVVSRQSSSTS